MSAIRVGVLLAVFMQSALSLAAERRAEQPAAPAASAPVAADGTTMGRLFYTAAQRATLDELRRRPQRVAQDDKAPSLPPTPEYVTLNGVIRRSDGTTTVWLNDKQVRGHASQEGLEIAPARRGATPNGVTVRVPQTGRSVDLKVGQQLEVNSGEVKEAYRAPQRASAGPAAEAASPVPAQDTPSPRDRRASREREALRDLLREIESPASAGAPAAPASPPATPPR